MYVNGYVLLVLTSKAIDITKNLIVFGVIRCMNPVSIGSEYMLYPRPCFEVNHVMGIIVMIMRAHTSCMRIMEKLS